jgi:hypothetical protein
MAEEKPPGQRDRMVSHNQSWQIARTLPKSK